MSDDIDDGRLDFSPSLLAKGSLSAWLILLALLLAGALAGYLISLVKTPIYQATASVSTNLELVQDANITEVMVDAELDHVSELAYHPEVVDTVLGLSSIQLAGSASDFKQMTSVEREMMTTHLKVRHTDAEVATRVASAWAESFYNRLQAAYPYALRVSEAKAMLVAIDDCAHDPVKGVLPFCVSLTPEKAQILTEEANQVILADSAATLGLTQAINISQWQPASIPERPLWNHRGYLILGGSLIGLVVGMAFTLLPIFRRRDV